MGGSVLFLISILFFSSFSSLVGFLVAMIGQRPPKEGLGGDTYGPRITYSSAPPPPDLFLFALLGVLILWVWFLGACLIRYLIKWGQLLTTKAENGKAPKRS